MNNIKGHILIALGTVLFAITVFSVLFFVFWRYFSPSAIENLAYEELGGGYIHYEDEGFNYINGNPMNIIDIPYEVQNYRYDDKFIVAKQIEYYFSEKEQKLNFNEKYAILLKNGIVKYWIINKNMQSTYGPMSKDEFIVLSNKWKLEKKLLKVLE